ncbi:MAG: HD domain-containing protein [Bacteroidota bacterium]
MEIPSEFQAYYHLAKGLYQTGPSHDFSHIERVFNLSLKIGKSEGADLRILGIAALFHDIARDEESQSNGEICHATAGALQTKRILEEQGEEQGIIETVAECIATHRYRDQNPPRTLEGKCLFDADKLDSLGAVGIARAYLWLGERGGTVYVPREVWEKTDFSSNLPEDDSLQREWHLKFQYLKDQLFTRTARQMAVRRNQTMVNFLETLEREVNGEE